MRRGSSSASIRRFPPPANPPSYIPKPLDGGDFVSTVRRGQGPRRKKPGPGSAADNVGAHDREVLERLRRRRCVIWCACVAYGGTFRCPKQEES